MAVVSSSIVMFHRMSEMYDTGEKLSKKQRSKKHPDWECFHFFVLLVIPFLDTTFTRIINRCIYIFQFSLYSISHSTAEII